jgi:hypothetical protein
VDGVSADIFDQIAAAGYEDVIYALQQDRTPDMVRRFVLGREPAINGTESFEAKRAQALVDRLFEFILPAQVGGHLGNPPHLPVDPVGDPLDRL